MSKTYKASVTGRAALPRSKRLRDGGSSEAISSSVTFTGSTGNSSGEGALTQDVTADIAAGRITVGQLLETGMTFTQFVRKLLTQSKVAVLTGKLSTPNDVEYGTKKGTITYTSNRNSSGVMKQAYMDDDETRPLIFSEETDGVQTAVRTLEGVYTQGETYKATAVYEAGAEGIPETTLECKISVNVRRKWFAGVCASVPTTSAQVRALSGGGLYTGKGMYKFSVGAWKMLAICIPEGNITDITVTAYPGNFIEDGGVCSGPTTVSVEGAGGSAAADYKMWIIRAETLNDADTFTFQTS